jgi:Fic family protein
MDRIKRIEQYQKLLNMKRPFEEKVLDEIRRYYRVGLTWSSNSLEGNSLTESETKILIEDGLTVGGKPLRDSLEAVGHAAAYDYMFTLTKSRGMCENDIRLLHQLFYERLGKDAAGVYRQHECIVTGSKYPVADPQTIQIEMRALIQWISAERDKLHPVEFAAQLHKRFVFIHPFEDGNGRVARLIMNLALLQDGYMLAVVPPVLRHEYIETLERAHTDDRPFVEFIADRVLETQKDMMRLLHIQIPVKEWK